MADFGFSLLLLFVALGLLTGFLAGLLGIGGGILLVPVFLHLFPRLGFPESSLVHMALGTSLAVILPTAVSSTLGHRKRGNVDWRMALWLGSAGLLGAFLGGWLAAQISGAALKTGFGALLLAIGLKFLLVQPRSVVLAASPVTVPWLLLVGLISGTFSAFFGIGGGVVAVPLLVGFLGVPIHRAVGTGSALIVVSAFSGALSYTLHGLGAPDLPPHALGYVHVPAAAILSICTLVSARIGVRVASCTPQDKLTRTFAMVLLLVGLDLLLKE